MEMERAYRPESEDGVVMQYIVVTIAVWPEEDAWVSKCLELGTVSEGDSEQEALHNIREATELYLDTLEDLGECRQVLDEKGVVIHTLDPAEGPAIERPIEFPTGRQAIRPAVFPVTCAKTA